MMYDMNYKKNGIPDRLKSSASNVETKIEMIDLTTIGSAF